MIHIDDFDFSTLTFTPEPKEGGGKLLAQQICSFDIETTRISELEQSVMYIWQFAVEETVIYGRTWSEFRRLLRKLRERLGNMRLLVFVHNLSYEFQFLSGIYNFSEHEVFCTEARHILKCSMYGKFEFRCSYRLTDMSLAATAKRYNVKYQKYSGEDFDYSKRRFSSTPMTEAELAYCEHDVLAVVESVHAIMKLNGDTVYTLPMTSTGFVRRNVKTEMYDYYHQMREEMPPYRCYQMLKSAFRGGNTHANRFYVGEIMSDVTSYDISSSYPSQQCNRKFPVGEWTERLDLSTSAMERRIDRGAALIMHIVLRGVTLRDPYTPVPYIPVAKCMRLVYPTGAARGLCVDNGRVIQAELLEMCVTSIDWRIVTEQYSIQSAEIVEEWSCWTDYLPEPIRRLNVEYFQKKTMLKGLGGDNELYYFKNKELLNSIYSRDVSTGCCEAEHNLSKRRVYPRRFKKQGGAL